MNAAKFWRSPAGSTARPQLLDSPNEADVAGSSSAPGSAITASRRSLPRELLRYLLVGGLAFLLDWAVLRLAIGLGAHYLLATALGFVAGLALNYALCIFWVWRGTRATTLRDLTVFTLIGIGGLLLTEGLMRLAVETVGLSAPLAKLPVAGLVLLWNFGLRRLFVFFR